MPNDVIILGPPHAILVPCGALLRSMEWENPRDLHEAEKMVIAQTQEYLRSRITQVRVEPDSDSSKLFKEALGIVFRADDYTGSSATVMRLNEIDHFLALLTAGAKAWDRHVMADAIAFCKEVYGYLNMHAAITR